MPSMYVYISCHPILSHMLTSVFELLRESLKNYSAGGGFQIYFWPARIALFHSERCGSYREVAIRPAKQLQGFYFHLFAVV
uniref:Secreted protein n=1 Tax=Parascaris univalens TaxID=6257 RepID=A0A915AD55_PARUN